MSMFCTRQPSFRAMVPPMHVSGPNTSSQLATPMLEPSVVESKVCSISSARFSLSLHSRFCSRYSTTRAMAFTVPCGIEACPPTPCPVMRTRPLPAGSTVTRSVLESTEMSAFTSALALSGTTFPATPPSNSIKLPETGAEMTSPP